MPPSAWAALRQQKYQFHPSAAGVAHITISLDYNAQYETEGLPLVTAQFAVTVSGAANNAPTAAGDTAIVPLGGTVTILENGSPRI